MKSLLLKAMLEVQESAAELGQAYAREVRWPQGFRVNVDSRLMLLGIRRLLARGIITDAQLRTAAFVMGCRLGAMDSYESFDCGLMQGKEVPLAFAYALPCIPLACASICHSLRGITYTVTGESNAGILAFSQAVALLQSSATDIVVTGCWESPSATAGGLNSFCKLLLLVLERSASPEACEHGEYPAEQDFVSPAATDAVDSLKHFVANAGIAAPGEVCHA